MSFEPLLLLLVKGDRLLDVVPAFEPGTVVRAESFAGEGTIIKVPASRIINPAQTSPLVLAAKEAVKLFEENQARLKEATGNSIRYQIIEEAIIKLKTALP